MQKTFNFFYAFLLALLGFGVTLMAENITLTTYYPAPYGAFDELNVTDSISIGIANSSYSELDVGDSNGDGVGEIRISSSDVSSLTYSQLLLEDTVVDPGNINLWAIAHKKDLGLPSQDALHFARWDGAGVGTVPLVINTDGKVGIGTTDPNYTLDVVGDINTAGDVRKNGSAYSNPDYVFEPGYSLMPISELSSYVLENRHLPNMPSSEDIKQDGVKLFEQNRLLLEKIEEAHLYIIELEKRIKQLERK